MRRSGRDCAIGSAEKVGVRQREEEGPSLITYRRQRSNLEETLRIVPSGTDFGAHPHPVFFLCMSSESNLGFLGNVLNIGTQEHPDRSVQH